MIRDAFRLDIEIVPDENEVSDRSMVGDAFLRATGYRSPDWPDLVAQLADDPHPLREVEINDGRKSIRWEEDPDHRRHRIAGEGAGERLLSGEMGDPANVIVFSRDEAKQYFMRIGYERRSTQPMR